MQPTDFFPQVQAPAAARESEVYELASIFGKNKDALGRLVGLGAWLAACHDCVPPRPISNPKLVVFAGDHGVAKKGVSALDLGASVSMVESITSGCSPTSTAARVVNVPVRVVDISLDHDVFGHERVSKACGSIDEEDAMSVDEFKRALEIGISIADQEIDSGADLLLVGDVGVGNTTAAAVVAGMYTNSEPVVVVGRGSGIDDEGWKHKVAAVRDAMFRVRGKHADIFTVARQATSPDMVAMAGFIAQAACRRTPVVIDGLTTTAAAIMADRMAPGARKWMQAGQLSMEPAHSLALQYLNLEAINLLRIDTGAGVGALSAVPLLRIAADVLNDLPPKASVTAASPIAGAES